MSVSVLFDDDSPLLRDEFIEFGVSGNEWLPLGLVGIVSLGPGSFSTKLVSYTFLNMSLLTQQNISDV